MPRSFSKVTIFAKHFAEIIPTITQWKAISSEIVSSRPNDSTNESIVLCSEKSIGPVKSFGSHVNSSICHQAYAV